MEPTIVTALVGLFCTSMSSVVTFILTRKKYSADVETVQMKNVHDSFELYKQMMNDTVTVQNEKISQLQRENEDLKNQIFQLQSQVAQMLSITCYDTSCRKRIGGKVKFSKQAKQKEEEG